MLERVNFDLERYDKNVETGVVPKLFCLAEVMVYDNTCPFVIIPLSSFVVNLFVIFRV